jgi:50S ribosomal protein L16 3-hydroxylase
LSVTGRLPSLDRELSLLAGLTPREFMRRHWQRRPLLVHNAIPGFVPPTSRQQLFALANREDVESRLVRKTAGRWSLVDGPLSRTSLPPLGQRRWTLLVQGVDLHDEGAHRLLQAFRFVPDARLDDLMISWASDGGGVGPHADSYDVFLLQASGTRRWRIARRFDAALDERAPLKVLRRFVPEHEYVLGPGDLLYLPPNFAHEGVAVGGDCMTCSIGMRAPQRGALAGELAQRLGETYHDSLLYRDPKQTATAAPAAIPPALARFAADAVRRLVSRPEAIRCALGEVLSEPKPRVWFEKRTTPWRPAAVVLDRRTRMLYDARHVFINGEAVRARGEDATLLRRLADERRLDSGTVRHASAAARELLAEWFAAGWLTAG